MKTVTNYAEKKAKQFLNLLQGYTKGIRITAILILLLMGVNNAWAVNHTGGYVYFLKPSTWTESKVMMFIGHNSYTSVYEMTKVSNTDNLYRYTMPSWGGATYVAFANAGSVWGTGNWGPSNRTNAPHYTNVYNNYGFNSGSYYVVVPASTSNNAGITINYKSSASNLNLTTRANVYGSIDGGSTYSSMAAAGTVSVSGYYMSNYSTASTRSAVSSTASQAYASTTLAPGSTATFKATANTGYEFVGWFDAESGGTAVSTDATYTFKYDISYADKTLYARFKQIQHTVSYGVCSTTRWGSIKLNSETAITTTGTKTLNYGTSISFTATPNVGYQVEGWYSNSGCTSKITAASTSKTYDAGTLTADKIVYVKFEAIPANNHNITYTAQATGWTYGVSNPTSAEEGAPVTFEVIPTTGYTVTVTSSDVSLSGNGNSYTFTMPTKDVTINVSATEKTHDVTISYKCGDQTIQANGTATAVGEITAKEITAPEITGYKFTSWTLGDGITNKSDNTTTNPINITTKASGTYTLTANYEEVVTIYFVNSSKWTTVACHHWTDGGSGTSWPGDQLTTTGETVNEFDVYKATFTSEHDLCIFNNNGSGQQTANLEVQDGKYYYLLKNEWYDSLNDIPAIDPLATNVFIAGGMNGWSTNTDEFRKATKEATTASIILNLTEGTYKFKIMDNGTWLGNNGTISSTISGWTFANSGGDCTLEANIAGDYTFTWTINSSKLDVTYPTLYAVTATANDAAMGTITGAGDYGKNATATLTATPNDGYLFVNWTKGGVEVATTQEYSFKVTEAVELVANFEAAPEVHNVTVSYLCGGNKIADDETVAAVGETTAKTVEAPEIWGYTFSSWTLGEDVKSADALTSSTIDINIVADGSDFTLTANYTEIPKVTVYFVNNKKWSKVYAYGWGGSVGENPAWPGQEITANKEDEQIVGFDVYSYSVVPGSYNNIIFNNGSGTQTETFKWTDGKYYYMGAAENYAGGTKEEVADLLLSTTIYFKNNLGWENVYVYFHTSDSYWDETYGSGAYELTEQNGRAFKMDRIGESDIYKCYYGGTVPTNSIVFTKDKKEGEGNFSNTKASYRTDFDSKMQLFIPQNTKTTTKNSTEYYNEGLWMKYNSTESGYTITGDFNGWDQESDKFTSETSGGYIFQKELLLSSGHTYEFKIKNIKNDWFRTATAAITSTKNTDIDFTAGNGDNVKITALSAGYYIFSIDLSTGKMLVSVEYPLMVGDYRMVYVENEVLGVKPYVKFHPAQSIRGITEGDKLDTVSFFINKTKGKNPAILLQRCSNINGAIITWEDIAIQYINDISGAPPTAAKAPAKKSAELYIGDGCPAVTKDAVYNFVLEQTNTGSHKAQILAENTHLYEGNYYIRTDGAAGGWSKYNTNPDNIMTHSQTALTHGGYDYYFCEWMLKDNNVKYVVANDYSYCVSDTLAKDDIVTDENGNLPADANVRYTWNSSTNALKRAYINGSGNIADRYLVLIGNEYLKDTTGNTFPANETTFADMGNWLYQVDVKASDATSVKLTANYNDTTQYFKGDAESAVNIITGATNYYKFRLIYDFKTNYLLCGLIEDGKINETITVDEAMISRSHHDQAQTFQVAADKSITTIKTVYGVMNFNKTKLNNNSKSQYERALYWVSFPFDVDLGKAFGFGNYGEHWIMEYYDGEARAANGLWVDSDTYWKYITNPNYILEAGKGYVLCLDLDLLKESASLWDNTDDIALYFPSKDENITINDKPALKDIDVKPLTCTIERDDRKTKDSNWNIIGVPAYTNFPDIDTEDIGFYYEYDKSNNGYAVNNAAVFDCMHAYMVQFAGRIEWSYNRVSPAIAARRNAAGKDQYTLRLALQQEGTQCDHTFIRLQEDNVTAEFDMNYDLCKIINSGANVYSMIGNVEVAANVLPVEERIIPLGLDIEEDGNYTFAMPDGTDGITAILIDYETGKETNLLLADYTVELNAGIDNERFALRLRPSYVATEVENTILTDGNDNVKKYIIDGALYLLRDGKLYDAQGRMIQQ